MPKRTRTKKKEKKNIPTGVVHIQSTFNNTIVTITDPAGNVVGGHSGEGVYPIFKPVLESLVSFREQGVWLEVTHLVIPTLNDDLSLIRRMAGWMVRELGPETPLHFSRFHPMYRMRNLPPTPVETLERARAFLRDAADELLPKALAVWEEGMALGGWTVQGLAEIPFTLLAGNIKMNLDREGLTDDIRSGDLMVLAAVVLWGTFALPDVVRAISDNSEGKIGIILFDILSLSLDWGWFIW